MLRRAGSWGTVSLGMQCLTSLRGRLSMLCSLCRLIFQQDRLASRLCSLALIGTSDRGPFEMRYQRGFLFRRCCVLKMVERSSLDLGFGRPIWRQHNRSGRAGLSVLVRSSWGQMVGSYFCWRGRIDLIES